MSCLSSSERQYFINVFIFLIFVKGSAQAKRTTSAAQALHTGRHDAKSCSEDRELKTRNRSSGLSIKEKDSKTPVISIFYPEVILNVGEMTVGEVIVGEIQTTSKSNNLNPIVSIMSQKITGIWKNGFMSFNPSEK
ncbi:8868_t:CDS:2 [Paraglomus occultum]|uniref:8868_t:CDS:1 n=1 Tax=Paraglomus occultum TaxID=144539 RepID=A0A9N9FLU3_9GLOM|nr:8868_t:CDS:2 [Paraglomus occultum]